MTILDEILADKRDELAAAKRRERRPRCARAPSAWREATRGFRAALASGPRPRVIAEIKRRSPSRGEIRPDFDPVGCARAYAEAGAAAISVLTDEHYFGGELSLLAPVRREVSLPLLRKDFLVDAYQVDEARVAGADAVLLIARALGREQLRALRERAAALGLDALVEVHDEARARRGARRGRRPGRHQQPRPATFDDRSRHDRAPGETPRGGRSGGGRESGIFTPDDVRRLEAAGAARRPGRRGADAGARRGSGARALAGDIVKVRVKICGIVHARRRAGRRRRGRGSDRAQLRAGLAALPATRRRRAHRRARGRAGRARGGVLRRRSRRDRARACAASRSSACSSTATRPRRTSRRSSCPSSRRCAARTRRRAERYPGAILLLDHPTEGGGRGQAWNWADAGVLIAAGYDVILAGGLDPENVRRRSPTSATCCPGASTWRPASRASRAARIRRRCAPSSRRCAGRRRADERSADDRPIGPGASGPTAAATCPRR